MLIRILVRVLLGTLAAIMLIDVMLHRQGANPVWWMPWAY